MKETDRIVKILADKVRNLDEYKEYRRLTEALKEKPELYRKVCEYRRKVFLFQNRQDEVNTYEADALLREREFLNENPDVDRYLKAELAFCRKLQNFVNGVIREIDFELGFEL